MGYKPKKWPSYALQSLEDSIALTIRGEKLVDELQQAILEGDRVRAMLMAAKVNVALAQMRENLIRGKNGDYSREE